MKFFAGELPPVSRGRVIRGIVAGLLAFLLFGFGMRLLVSVLPDWAWFLPSCVFFLLVAAWSLFIRIHQRKSKSRRA